MKLSLVALGFLASEADNKVREIGGNNLGPRIRRYAANADPPMKEGVPWCALLIQTAWDVAARTLGVPNPLDAVKLEALVQSYFDAFKAEVLGAAVRPEPGDLVLFKFPRDGKPSETWNHIGMVAQVPNHDPAMLWAIEGNTSDVDQRDGDGVYFKPRDRRKQETCFIRVPTS